MGRGDRHGKTERIDFVAFVAGLGRGARRVGAVCASDRWARNIGAGAPSVRSAGGRDGTDCGETFRSVPGETDRDGSATLQTICRGGRDRAHGRAAGWTEEEHVGEV